MHIAAEGRSGTCVKFSRNDKENRITVKMHLLSVLREGTAQLHTRLDRTISQNPVTTRAGYERFLNLQAAVLPGAERWLAGTDDFRSLPDFNNRLRTGALLRDLQGLGHAVPGEQDLPYLNAGCSVAGICYVLEGARLGAAQMHALLDRAAPDLPAEFLAHGRGCGLWKSFLTWLAAHDNSTENCERACLAAQQLFGTYLQVLERENSDEVDLVGQG
ncbi:biliverdin-producing heme oxygenase [Roseibium sp.]|uniref:biliverdin-producing heme oxygenase n=1 Tax=Roseibium sp. TaxID=1936156 RepID=UPI003264ED96